VALISLRNKTPDFGVADDGRNATVTGLNWLERFEVFSKSPVGRQKKVLKLNGFQRKPRALVLGGITRLKLLAKHIRIVKSGVKPG
jgi:hypothetical protein